MNYTIFSILSYAQTWFIVHISCLAKQWFRSVYTLQTTMNMMIINTSLTA